MIPITSALYRKHNRIWWLGKKVRSVRRIDTGYHTIPSGTVFTITDKYGGFSLRLIKECPRCKIGKKTFVTRVSPDALELLTETVQGKL